MPKKKKTRRSNEKYPALKKRFMPKVRQEYLDMDYIDDLNEEEKAWLNKFMDEELNAHFKNDERDITQSKEEKKEIYGKNNARNRCIYGIAKASNMVVDDVRPENDMKITDSGLFEDYMIDQIDKKRASDNGEDL